MKKVFAYSFMALATALGSGCTKKEEEATKVVFPIGGYSGNPERDRAAGFTVAGPTYGAQRDGFLAQCEEAGLPCFYPVGVEIDFLGKRGPEPMELDREAIEREIKAQVSAVVENRLIQCWYLTPEELRYWRPLEMEYLRIASETITATDPMKRPVWMYEPGHRTQAALEKTVPYLGIVGKGVYPNYSGKREERAWVVWTVEQQAAAVRAAQPAAEPYGIMEMLKKPEEQFTEEEIQRWVRYDAYAALTGGVRGILIFSFGNRAGFHAKSPEWQAYYEAWAGVARELNGPLALGSVFLAGQGGGPPECRVTKGEEAIPLELKGEEVRVGSVKTAAYRWGGAEYRFFINTSREPIRLEVAEGLAGWQPLLAGQPGVPKGRELALAGYDVAVFKK